VLRVIARLPVVVQEAADQAEPSFVARWLLDLAAEFSRYYTLGNQDRTKRVVLEGNEPLKAARLALTDAVRSALAAGLSLLGIATPENM
jgi:arginyl-tRNA synthetase